MKKLIAMITALVLCLSLVSAVSAEEVFTMDWEAMEAGIAEAGVEGEFYKLGGVNVLVWVPNFMELDELTDEDIENGFIAYFADENGASTLAVTLNEVDMDIEAGMEFLIDAGVTEIEEVRINGLRALMYSYENDAGELRVGVSMFSKGYNLEFTFTFGDEDFETTYVYIMSSIQLEQ